MFKNLFGPLLNSIPWRTLLSMLIKQKVMILNCLSDILLNLIHLGGNHVNVEKWHILYDAVGGEAPLEKYVEYQNDCSLKLMEVVPWSARDRAWAVGTDEHKSIILLHNNQGAGGDQGNILLTVCDVSDIKASSTISTNGPRTASMSESCTISVNGTPNLLNF